MSPTLLERRERWLRVFFGVAACSWMPHWSCHYYRLETGSSFVVGSWEFSPTASAVHMLVYTLLIALNLAVTAWTSSLPELDQGIVAAEYGFVPARLTQS